MGQGEGARRAGRRGSWVGVDLHLDLSGTRVRAGLEGALRDAIRGGRLRAGTRLPSSRALAADLGIARNTVAEVYSQLVAEGWLTARTGSGTSVAPHRAPAPGAAVSARPAQAVPRFDLRAGAPDLSAFPRRAWLATARKVLANAPDYLLGYPDPRGLPQLRAALAELPGPGAGRDRRSRAHRHLRGLRARPGRHQPRAARCGLGHPRGGGLWPPDPPRHRGRAGPAPAADCRSTAWAPSSPRLPGRMQCC